MARDGGGLPPINAVVENGAQVTVPAGGTCQLTPTLVNTVSATWLPGARPAGGVVLHTSAGDLPLQNSLSYLQRTDWAPLGVSAGQGANNITGRLNIQGVGAFGETLRLTLIAQ